MIKITLHIKILDIFIYAFIVYLFYCKILFFFNELYGKIIKLQFINNRSIELHTEEINEYNYALIYVNNNRNEILFLIFILIKKYHSLVTL